jgi:hypothetical protein
LKHSTVPRCIKHRVEVLLLPPTPLCYSVDRESIRLNRYRHQVLKPGSTSFIRFWYYLPASGIWSPWEGFQRNKDYLGR